MKRIVSVIFALVMTLQIAWAAAAETKDIFAGNAYATILTASDFQQSGDGAYVRFGEILSLAQKDGLPAPDSMLVGGDYTMVLLDNAVPGISRIRNTYLTAFPDADPRSVVCIQGNHDNSKAEFAKTGFYDMGAYCLFVINENDFPWKQYLRADKRVKAVADELEKDLDRMIADGDRRPVIVMTHVPLHHTRRFDGGDNLYASYLFTVLNEKAAQLDIVFIFGHNHSGKHDDYIGGSVNFMKPGDKIRIPDPENRGKDGYTEETLRFTYTNCGYIGYSENTQSETSTNVLTMGIIQLTEDSIRFIKYDENGVYCVNDTERQNRGTTVKPHDYPALNDKCLCHSDNVFLKAVWKVWLAFAKLFDLSKVCTCGKTHY